MRNAGRAEKTEVGDIRGQIARERKRGSAKIEREQETRERETLNPNAMSVYSSQNIKLIFSIYNRSFPNINDVTLNS